MQCNYIRAARQARLAAQNRGDSVRYIYIALYSPLQRKNNKLGNSDKLCIGENDKKREEISKDNLVNSFFLFRKKFTKWSLKEVDFFCHQMFFFLWWGLIFVFSFRPFLSFD